MSWLRDRHEYHQRWDEFAEYVEREWEHGRNDQNSAEYQRLSKAVDDAGAKLKWWQR